MQAEQEEIVEDEVTEYQPESENHSEGESNTDSDIKDDDISAIQLFIVDYIYLLLLKKNCTTLLSRIISGHPFTFLCVNPIKPRAYIRSFFFAIKVPN